MASIFEQITAQIIEAVKQGAGEYVMPWHRTGGAAELPRNVLTGNSYRGANVVTLWVAAAQGGFSSNEWGTYRQWAQLGAQVRKGERGSIVLFWKTADHGDEADGDDRDNARRFIARAARVFNAAQVDRYEPDHSDYPLLDPAQRASSAQTFLDNLPAQVWHGGDEAFFDRASDMISMPPFEQFRSAEAYASVHCHELLHWTGHKARLNRNLSGRFGSEAYAMEELIAELGAAFLCSQLGIATEARSDHAPYIASWLKVLRGDPRAIVSAASQAQAAVDYLLGGASAGNAKNAELEEAAC